MESLNLLRAVIIRYVIDVPNNLNHLPTFIFLYLYCMLVGPSELEFLLEAGSLENTHRGNS